MAIEWTTVSLVRSHVKAGSKLSDAEIEDIIQMCEGELQAYLKQQSGTFTFAVGTKTHWALRDYVTMRAAMIVIATTPMSFRTPAEAELAMNLYYAFWTLARQNLGDSGIVDAIEND